MTAFRAIPIEVHAALEVVAAPLLLVAPFLFGFGAVAGAISIALGVLLIGVATDDFAATIFMVGFGSAHLGLAASTRYSRPLGA